MADDALRSLSGWVRQHSNDIAVNLLSDVPFFLLDVLLIAIALPLAIEFLRDRRTREIRVLAIHEVIECLFRHIGSAAVIASQETDIYQRGGQTDFELRERLVAEFRRAMAEASDELPLVLPILDPKSLTLAIDAHRWFRRTLEFLVHATGQVIELDENTAQQVNSAVLDHELENAAKTSELLRQAIANLENRSLEVRKTSFVSRANRFHTEMTGLLVFLSNAMSECLARSGTQRDRRVRIGSLDDVLQKSAEEGAGAEIDAKSEPKMSNSPQLVHLIRGKLAPGRPFWAFVAIKAEMKAQFDHALASGSLDLSDFDAFGEVIVSAEGVDPPPETAKGVIGMYGLSPDTTF